MPGYSTAFISYQTENRAVAGQLRDALAPAGITAFLAHEDIEVSVEWRGRLLQELHRADVFVAVLSAAYLRSAWCIQESGIAAFKPELLVVPLSLDGTVPPAFLGGFQSARLDAATLSAATLAPAYTSRDVNKGLFNLISVIAASRNYRNAEANFSLAMPYVAQMQPDHVDSLLSSAVGNEQVSNAAKCAAEYIPAVLKAHPKIGPRKARAQLKEICRRYGAKV
jgi:TIR domain